MKNKKLKKKILFDLRLLILLIPSILFGFLSSPYIENKISDIPAILSGSLSVPAIIIIPYLIISWLFYDKFYK